MIAQGFSRHARVISSCIIRYLDYLIIACMIPLGIVSATIEIGCRKDTTAKIIV